MKKWVKQEVNFLDIRAIYTDITTNQRIQKTRLGQCLVYNTNTICQEPTDIFVPQEFEGWEFYAGGNIVDEDEEEACAVRTELEALVAHIQHQVFAPSGRTR